MAGVRDGASDYIGARMGAMVSSTVSKWPVMPPAEVFNERWLLRFIIDWFATNPVLDHPFTVPPNGHWFSEGVLPTAFSGGGRLAKLAETPSRVDGVIGHVSIGEGPKAEMALLPEARHFVVVSAKLFGGLSRGPAGAKYFDEAARVAGCMAEVLSRANREPSHVPGLGFYVVAPQVEIARGLFLRSVTQSAVGRKVKRRATEYGGKKSQWYSDWFEPALEQMEVGTLSWEELLRLIREQDPASAASLQWFYQQCISFSEPVVSRPKKRKGDDEKGGLSDPASST
ncbi:MAG: hypothetical protein ACOC58_01075 [Chloroflexota bacterium]